MSNAITRALVGSQRSYIAAKASVAETTNALLARGPAGSILAERPDLARAHEQLRHFSGWVYSSIRPIAQRIAGQPVRVGRVRNRRLGSKVHQNAEPLDRHEILDLLHDPNDLMVSWSLMFSTVASLELTGRQLWWLPDRKQILPIPTSWLVGFEGVTRFTAFKVRPPHTGEAFSLPADECVYFAYPDPADPHGAVAPLQAAAAAVNADESMQASQAAAFGQGINPRHAIIVGKDAAGRRPRLTASQQQQIVDAVLKRHGDVWRHGEPAILDGLIADIKPLSRTPAEMDWLGSSKTMKARITQGFGTNPIVMGELEGANRASATVADRHFVDFTVNPKIELLSQCLTEYLSPMFGGGLAVWVEPAVANDAEMQLRRMDLAAKNGAVTANELRAFAGLPEEPGFAGVVLGGRQTGLANAFETSIAEAVDHRLAALAADEIVQEASRFAAPAGGNGNGRA